MNEPLTSKTKLEQLHDMLHTDQTGLAAGLEAVLKTVAGYRWVETSRGSYEWDDDEYRKEMGYMLDAVHKCAEGALTRWKAGGIPRPCCDLARAADEPSDTPVAWIIPGDDNAYSNGAIDARISQEGEFTRPLYARPAEPPAAWQPSETAPADQNILLYCPERHYTNPERIELGLFRSTGGGWEHQWATHWMPLPAYPGPSPTKADAP